MVLTYTMLALAVLALWCDGGESDAGERRNLWLPLLVVSLTAALWSGVVQPVGLAAVALLVVVTRRFSRVGQVRWLTVTTGVLTLLFAGGLMLHLVPGFNNMRVIDAVRFTPDAIPFTLYLNFDKTVAGIFLLGWCQQRIARASEWRAMFVAAAPWAVALIALLLVLSFAMGYVRLAPKFPPQTWLWLGVNLIFVCSAEEMLFRGFIQSQLQRICARLSGGRWLALGVAAVLFGLAHYAGGAKYIALATVAGVGYGWIYQRTGRIEASILTHFSLNTLHFFLFTYPALSGAH